MSKPRNPADCIGALLLVTSLAAAASTKHQGIDPPEVGDPKHHAYTAAGDLKTPQAIIAAVRVQLDASMREAGYEPERIDKLAERIGQLLSVQASGSYDDYVRLAHAWGAKHMCERMPTDQRAECERSSRNRWTPASKSLDRYAITEVGVVAYDRNTESPLSSIPMRMPRGKGMVESTGSLEFSNDPNKMIRSKADVVLVTVPTADSTGHPLLLMYHWVWDSKLSVWLPLRTYVLCDHGYPCPEPNF